ncbi:MAG TPA: CHAD domain-containing protein [Terriglobales bacterium]|jgi:CHAD domain-containing protein|nr:CHAD domain-containing protein [Terriglobales bacterium]
MAIDFERVQKPARKLRKLLKTMSAEPTPEHVHDFRTNSRNMEATLQAFALENSGLGRRVLKPLSRLRKRAGKVRDMDVLTTYAASVDAKDGEKDCAVRLLEYLGARRHKYARKFHSASRQDGTKLRRRLKQVQRELGRKEESIEDKKTLLADPSSSALKLASELGSIPRLDHSNLHPFRLQVKELQNVLRLADAADQDLIAALATVKRAIGEWHDWEELVNIADKVLDHGAQCKLMQHLKSTTRDKFESALSQAEKLRKRYFGVFGKKKPSRRSAEPAEPVVRSAMKLVG